MDRTNSGGADDSREWTTRHVLRWAFTKFGSDVAIASAFGAEGMVLIDIASHLRPDFRVFTLDTGFLFPETYELMDRVEERYGVKIERVYPAVSPEEQDKLHGPALWSRAPDQCCGLRKVDPLQGKLADLRAWITGIRRDQTTLRATAQAMEWDLSLRRVKINPLIDWTAENVWQYIRKYDVPYNPLHDRGYPSIGCTHCTRAVKAGEDPRAGRWSGFQKNECGLHAISPPSLTYDITKAI
jgi:phosphoadenosine phosphosulfate reductase